MIRNRMLLLAIMIVTVYGCGKVNVKENLITLDRGYFPDTPTVETQGISTENKREHPSLRSAYRQIHGEPAQEFSTESINVLPAFMLDEPLVKKIVDATYRSLIERSETAIDITIGDIKRFAFMTAKNYGPASIFRDDGSRTHEIIKKYLITYYSDTENGFVDREGTVYKRPEIRTDIGNDIITTVALIALEGLFDGILEVPVYTDGDDQYQTAKGLEPTVHKLQFARAEKLVRDRTDGIDKLELRGIRYLSGLASDQSKVLSGLAIRAFGDLEIGFGVGGHFSFGDNDTLAKVLDTIFEVASKRIVEASAYDGFSKLTWETSETLELGGAQSGAITLLQDLGNMPN